MAAEEEQRQQRKAAAKRRFRLAGRKVQVQNILGTLGGGLSVKEAAQRLAAGNAAGVLCWTDSEEDDGPGGAAGGDYSDADDDSGSSGDSEW